MTKDGLTSFGTQKSLFLGAGNDFVKSSWRVLIPKPIVLCLTINERLLRVLTLDDIAYKHYRVDLR